jgi:hypothetical protein
MRNIKDKVKDQNKRKEKRNASQMGKGVKMYVET